MLARARRRPSGRGPLTRRVIDVTVFMDDHGLVFFFFLVCECFYPAAVVRLGRPWLSFIQQRRWQVVRGRRPWAPSLEDLYLPTTLHDLWPAVIMAVLGENL